MSVFLTVLLIFPALLLFILAAFYALEVVGAFLPPRMPASKPAGPVAVVVPAHNEGKGIGPTLADIKRSLRSGDRLLVVADNCNDDTAEAAVRAGAAVLNRIDPTRLGKGYALQFAIDALREDPPAIVVFIDADCRVTEGTIERLAQVAAGGRPAQALYLVHAGEGAAAARRVAEFAWVLMNRARMSGLYTLFDTCRLTGSGMALSWKFAADLDLASGEIVEDLALGAQLAARGFPPVLCLDGVVTSTFPNAEESAIKQRARWEHGSLRLAARRAPTLFVKAIARGDIRLAAVALDLAIPPFIIFFVAALAMAGVSAVFLPLGVSAPFALAMWTIALLAAATGAAWIRFGRNILSFADFGALARYAGEKFMVYGRSARRSTRKWTRTGRDGEGDVS